MDVLDYPECLDEIIKYMDYLSDDEEERKAFIEAFVDKVVMA